MTWWISGHSWKETHTLRMKMVVYLVTTNCRRIMNTVKPIIEDLICNKTVEHSDVAGASPIGAASTTSYSPLNTRVQWFGPKQLQDETRNIYVLGFVASILYHRFDDSSQKAAVSVHWSSNTAHMKYTLSLVAMSFTFNKLMHTINLLVPRMKYLVCMKH